jgi:hypothetical protein
MQFPVTIDPELQEIAPDLRIAAITAQVTVFSEDKLLWEEMKVVAERVRGELRSIGSPCSLTPKALCSPTSDSLRPLIRPETKRILMMLVSFAADDALADKLAAAADSLRTYSAAREVQSYLIG